MLIHSIEKNKQLYYKSGGIAIDSAARSEYEELVDKIYLPLQHKPKICDKKFFTFDPTYDIIDKLRSKGVNDGTTTNQQS